MIYHKCIEDTVVDKCVCNACKGSGTFIGVGRTGDPVVMECDACGGTGTANPDLQRSALIDLGQRNKAQPGYDQPTRG
jgi:hypothetical protein